MNKEEFDKLTREEKIEECKKWWKSPDGKRAIMNAKTPGEMI